MRRFFCFKVATVLLYPFGLRGVGLEAFVMVTHEEVDEFFRRLLAGISAERRPDVLDQSKQLLSAFNRIRDPRLRQELLILVEIISQRPELLQSKHERWAKGALAPMH
jgi:hypothetical protein